MFWKSDHWSEGWRCHRYTRGGRSIVNNTCSSKSWTWGELYVSVSRYTELLPPPIPYIVHQRVGHPSRAHTHTRPPTVCQPTPCMRPPVMYNFVWDISC